MMEIFLWVLLGILSGVMVVINVKLWALVKEAENLLDKLVGMDE